MAYTRKTRDYWSIQQYTGGQYGWEEVCAENKWLEAKIRLREYRANQPEYPVRVRLKRERIETDADTLSRVSHGLELN